MSTILERILETKRGEIVSAKQRLPETELFSRIEGRKAERDFRAAIAEPGHLRLIAELKRQSPSRGLLRERFDPMRLAQELEDAGAAALSVLTDAQYFGGSLEILRSVHTFTQLPTLRKDFILERYQIAEALLHGADAILLIVRALDQPTLIALQKECRRYGLAALVEVHSAPELTRALDAGADILGINHRDLDTFKLDMNLIEQLRPSIPSACILVAESGLQTRDDLARMKTLGVHAALIGETLMTAPDPASKARELLANL